MGNRLKAAGLSVMVLLAACQQGHPGGRPPAVTTFDDCAHVFAQLHTAPSRMAADRADGACQPQRLVFTGAVHDTAVSGLISDQPCARPQRGQWFKATTMTVAVAAQPYQLTVNPDGTFDERESDTTLAAGGAAGVEVRSLPDYTHHWIAQPGGHLTTAADGMGGTIDVQLAEDVATKTQPLHITGTWRCGGAVPGTSPSPAATAGPCADYFAAAASAIADTGVPSPATGTCLNQNLTLSGGLTAQVTQAVNDLTHPDTNSALGSGLCGESTDLLHHAYVVTLEFAVGAEPFHLVLEDGVAPDAAIPYPNFGATYPLLQQDNASVHLHAGYVSWLAKTGTWTVAPDHHSGTVDMDLAETPTAALSINHLGPPPLANGGKPVHISGSWRCAP